jgi:hypothetical protein
VTASVVVTWRPRRLVLITHCETCGQSMPADHRTHINSGAGPDAPEPAPDPQKEIHS